MLQCLLFQIILLTTHTFPKDTRSPSQPYTLRGFQSGPLSNQIIYSFYLYSLHISFSNLFSLKLLFIIQVDIVDQIFS